MDVIFVSGGKGGVGKSFLSTAIAASCDVLGIDMYMIDADFRTADCASRYPDRSVRLDLADERGWNTLTAVLASEPARVAIVNLGADITGIDSKYAAEAAQIFSAIGQVRLVWALTPTAESLHHLADSAANGLMKHPAASRVIALNLLNESLTVADFSEYRESDARKDLLAGGAVEVVIPNLFRDYVAALRDKPFSAVINATIETVPALNLFGRVRARHWLEGVCGSLAGPLGLPQRVEKVMAKRK